jgi:hypothetical protein
MIRRRTMTRRRTIALAASLAGVLWALTPVAGQRPSAPPTAPLDSPEQLLGFRVGTDRKLARWNQIVEYMSLAAERSDRVRVRELGPSTRGQPFVVVEIGSPDTLENIERVRRLEHRLYFQDGIPTPAERDELFRDGKVVILITCSVHGHEIGATQMALELVHRLATDQSPATERILDNVLILLVPSANPDGQVLVTDWYNTNVDTPYEGSALPHLDHPYVGHDSNRDMYMLTQVESQYLARLAWHEWFPSIWLDQHQMSMTGPRMFVMPAADPINPNVHPLVYRWNAILGQSQAAALEAAGKDGIIYNSTYTNFWQGALAWNGWWHNQIGVLTEVASVRVASPVDQLRVMNDGAPPAPRGGGAGAPLAPPTDITPRTEYPRPWLGGRWTLRDIVDYELIATMALVETAADRRETLLRQIFEVNRQTVEDTRRADVASIVIPVERQRDPREVAHLVERLRMGGVVVERAENAFEVDGRPYAAGTFIVPMNQVFARYAKDLLERQTYPDVRSTPTAPPEPPYDVTAWSLGMLLGVQVDFLRSAPPASVRTTRVDGRPATPGRVTGNGTRFTFEYSGPDTAIAINRLLAENARVAFEGQSRVAVSRVARGRIDALAREFGLQVTASTAGDQPADGQPPLVLRAPRIALYSPWTGGNIDEGWTRWVLEQYGFTPTVIHNPDVRRGGLRQRFDAVIFADQNPREILDGYTSGATRPEYRGGIQDAGVEQIARFVAEGGTLITLGAASDLAIDRLPVPVRNLKRNLRREQHFAPGSIMRIQVDTAHPIGYGMAQETVGFYTNGPLFAPIDGLISARTSVIARYPAADILASGWLRGEEQMAGRAAVVSVDLNPGRIILFGLRPQHRAQTHATFPLLFNAIYLSAADDAGTGTNQ